MTLIIITTTTTIVTVAKNTYKATMLTRKEKSILEGKNENE